MAPTRRANTKNALDGRGRTFRRRRRTRVSLLRAAYEVMSVSGVDGAKIKEITDRADVGFGTFYNYFETKDEIAAHVLDCVINDIGRRNWQATEQLRQTNPVLVMPISIRLWMHEAMGAPMWEWWARRPDLLIDRMRRGFSPFATRDISDAIAAGVFNVCEHDVERLWGLVVWMVVGGMHEIVVNGGPPDSETLSIEAIMRVVGVDPGHAKRIACAPLPALPPENIDWTFEIGDLEEFDPAA